METENVQSIPKTTETHLTDTQTVMIETDVHAGDVKVTVTPIQKPKKAMKQPSKVVCTLCGRERDCRSMRANITTTDSGFVKIVDRTYTCRKTVKAEDGTVKCFIAEKSN